MNASSVLVDPQTSSKAYEVRTREGFSENICNIAQQRDLSNNEFFILYLLFNPVISNLKMFDAIMKSLIAT